MSKKTLHIISLDIPYPPDRGSVIGIFNRIKAFHKAGVDVILHAFYKNFSLPKELADYCKSVYLIPREKIWNIVNTGWPLYIQSRRSDGLVANLLKDDYPILFEGLHTLFHFDDPRLATRNKWVRMHNIESKYYAHLTAIHNNPFKKMYYKFESDKSDQIERSVLPKANMVFAISEKENAYLKSIEVKSICTLPFIENTVEITSGIGEYALYHGDLSILENEKAVLFLIETVFDDIPYPLFIAGKNPGKLLISKIRNNSNIKLFPSPEVENMKELIKNAQIILAPFSQTTGYKMKLLESIRMGRHIVASINCAEYTEISPLLHLANDPQEWKKWISILSSSPLNEDAIINREKKLLENFNPDQNIQQLISHIF
ncbi:MAG: glycosyltransferase [Saprospiraceae bacterium]|nr:glycosyltransferase [Saprospiraceae bacterium]